MGVTFPKYDWSDWLFTTHWFFRSIRAHCAFQKKGLHWDRN